MLTPAQMVEKWVGLPDGYRVYRHEYLNKWCVEWPDGAVLATIEKGGNEWRCLRFRIGPKAGILEWFQGRYWGKRMVERIREFIRESKRIPYFAPGSEVWIERGGGGAPGTVGSKRKVKGEFVQYGDGYQVSVKLMEDDPLSGSPDWSKSGEIGIWSDSAVTKR